MNETIERNESEKALDTSVREFTRTDWYGYAGCESWIEPIWDANGRIVSDRLPPFYRALRDDLEAVADRNGIGLTFAKLIEDSPKPEDYEMKYYFLNPTTALTRELTRLILASLPLDLTEEGAIALGFEVAG